MSSPNIPSSPRHLYLSLIALVTLFISSAAAEPAKPNIVFILADDLGYGDLPLYGQEKVDTPHIDTLAAEGMRFTDFYAGATICSPSRSVLMTGLHTGHTRIRGNMAPQSGIVGYKGEREVRRANLLESDTTIGHVLGDASYRTAVIGKWHLDGFNPEAGPLDRGFHEFYGWMVSEPGTYASTYFPPKRFSNRKLLSIPANQDGAEGYYHPDMCLDEAKAFIEKNRTQPFYLHIGLNLPHSPYRTNDFGPYAEKDWPEAFKHYAAMIHWTDQFVGALLQHLKQTGLDDNTIVFFTSDNGPRSEPRELQTATVDFFDSNGPLRGYKRDLSEGGIRVPLIVRWPGKIEAGSASQVPGYFADVMPTLAELAGTSPSANTDGLSLVPTFLGEETQAHDRFLYWEDFEGPFEQAVRWKNWKAIIPENRPFELYDLSKDIHEDHNLAGSRPEIVAAIRAYLKTARTESENWPLSPK